MLDIRQLVSAAPARCGGVRVVGIDGRGGSGKSTLAASLSLALNASVFHTDDFASWDNPLDWYGELIASVFEPIARGARVITFSPSKWWSEPQPAPLTREDGELIILEGVSALRSEFRPYLSVAVFVDVPRAIAVARGTRRDEAAGHPPARVAQLWESWADEEDRYFQRDNPKAFADIVVDGTRPLADQLQL